MPMHRRKLILGLASMAGESAAMAQVVLPPRPPRPPFPPLPPWRPLEPLVVEALDVETDVRSGVARSTVRVVLRNPSDQPREGDLLLPVPERAVVQDFSAYDGETKLESVVLDRDRAQAMYEEIVRSRRDPALLETAGLGALRVRIFPIAPRSSRAVVLELTAVLPRSGNAWRLEQCFRAPQLPRPETVRWEIVLHGIPSVVSPTHAVDIRQEDGRRTRVRFVAGGDDPALRESPEVVMLATPSDPDTLALSVIAHKDAEGGGTWAVVASPALPVSERGVEPPRALVLVMDCSGSMLGRKIEQGGGAMRAALATLRPVDSFQLVSFSDRVERLFPEPRRAKADALAEAGRWIDGLRADGGTNIDAGLAAGLRTFPGDVAANVLFFTDGRPTVGVQDTKAIVAGAAKASGKRARVFVFGVGYDVDVPFLDQLSGRLRGDADYVRPDEDIEAKAARFLARTSTALLTEPVLKVDGAKTRDWCPASGALPDVYDGSPWLVAGRFDGDPRVLTVELEGSAGGWRRRFGASLEIGANPVGSEWVGSLWASRRIGTLLDEIRLSDPDDARTKELIQTVVGLSKQYGILTPFTASFVPEPGRPLPPGGLVPDAGVVRGAAPTGEGAVNRSLALRAQRSQAQVGNRFALESLAGAEREAAGRLQESVRSVAGRIVVLSGGAWVQAGTEAVPEKDLVRVRVFSPLWFALSGRGREWARLVSIGERVRVRGPLGQVVEFGPSGLEQVDEKLLRALAP